MTQSFIVEYQGHDVSASVLLPGPLLIVPQLLKIKQKLGNRVVLEQNIAAVSQGMLIGESEAPDILVGSIPLIHFADDGVTPDLTYLKIPPPPPFNDGDVEIMWDEIRASGCPLPRSVVLQGEYAPGSAQAVTISQITAEYLNYAHQQCRHLLSRWPLTETHELVQRNIELRGGREDFPLTERHISLTPIFVTRDGRRIPQRTFRRRSIDSAWKSHMLREAASSVINAIYSQTTVQIPDPQVDRFIMPFAAVARLATPSRALVDPPLSTWPLDSRHCYESLLAAMAVLKADDRGMVPTPLSHLWRLYEAWVAVSCLAALIHRLGAPLIAGGPALIEGCEWIAYWQIAGDITITLAAQPLISNNGLAPSLRPILPIKSVSSDLKPDILLAISSKGTIRLIIVDAKKRSLRTAMDRGEVAATGSKYIWGIRVIGTDPGNPIPVRSALIVSTMPSETMHTQESLIESVCATPSREKEISDAICKRLDDIMAESL